MHHARAKFYYDGLKNTCGLIAPLRNFFRQPLTLDSALTRLRRALAEREENFLRLARERIYALPRSPYFKLLRHAGCEYADLEASTRRNGLDPTLEKLAGEGVYLTSEEFKGKIEIVRGSFSLRVDPSIFMLAPGPGFGIESSGTANAPVPTNTSLAWLEERAVITAAFLAGHDLFSHAHAMYDSILPGAGGMNNLLVYAKLGVPTERWFARSVPGYLSGLGLVNTYVIASVGKLAGVGFPWPEFIGIADLSR